MSTISTLNNDNKNYEVQTKKHKVDLNKNNHALHLLADTILDKKLQTYEH